MLRRNRFPIAAALGLAVLSAPPLAAQTAREAPSLDVIELVGEPAARGLAHGKALRAEIRALVARWRRWLRTTFGLGPEAFVERFLARTDFETAIDRWTPGLLDEVRGIARGVGIDYETMLAYQFVDEIWAQARGLLAEKCTVIALDRAPGRPTLVAQNLDLPRWYHGSQTLCRIRDAQGRESLVVTIPGLVAANGLNDRGVGVAVNTILQLRPSPDGLPVAFVVRGILAQKDFDAAVAFVKRVRHASGQCYTIGGPERAIAFECSATKVVPFRPSARATYTYHTNHPLVNDDLRPRLAARAEPMRFACPRFEHVERILAATKGPDTETVIGLLRSKVSRVPICHAQTYACTLMFCGAEPELRVSRGRPDQNAFRSFGFGETKRTASRPAKVAR